MNKSRFILRYRGAGQLPDTDLRHIHNAIGVSVIDTTPRMLLVETDDDRAKSLGANLKDWVVSAQKLVRLPDNRQKIEKSVTE